MGDLEPLWLVLAGLGGGLTGSVAGLASLVSYPALLAVGLPPVSANVSNTVALVFGSVGSVSGSVEEVRGQRARTRRRTAAPRHAVRRVRTDRAMADRGSVAGNPHPTHARSPVADRN